MNKLSTWDDIAQKPIEERTVLEEFIYNYDDADSRLSEKFFEDLTLLIKWVKGE